ncbi:WD repeat-containing protein 19 [Rhizophlyctis rosea]|nr:WD repeat-containing protein 19 [Rhizophlyctis rosea]
MKTPTGTSTPVLSMISGKKTLFLYNPSIPDGQVELSFQAKYGNIVTYEWIGEGRILVGFSSGFVVVVSATPDEMGQEQVQVRDHRDALTDVAVSSVMDKVATCGDNAVKIHELLDLKEMFAILTLDDEAGNLDKVQWSDDGQFLSVSTREGNIHTYLAKMPTIGGVWGTAAAYLTNLKEATISDQSVLAAGAGTTLGTKHVRKPLEVEPTAMALGYAYLGVAVNSRAWYYNLQADMAGLSGDEDDVPLKIVPIVKVRSKALQPTFHKLFKNLKHPLTKKDYINTITHLHMNTDYAAALLSSGELQIHRIEMGQNTPPPTLPAIPKGTTQPIARRAGGPISLEMQQRIFPEKGAVTKNPGVGDSPDAGFRITCCGLTEDFVVYGTGNGVLQWWVLDEWGLVGEFKHLKPIEKVCPQTTGGTKVIFTDRSNDGYVVDPLTNEVMMVPQWSAKNLGVIWDSQPSSDRTIFITYDDAFMSTYAYQSFTVKGPQCLALGSSKLPYGWKPVLVLDGRVTCQTPGGRLTTITLSTHEFSGAEKFVKEVLSEQEQGKRIQLLYTLGKMHDIWSLLPLITSTKPWTMLAEAAMRALDIPTARRVYRHMKDAGMVMTMDDIESMEDKYLMAGHVAAVFRDYSGAQELFLASSNPQAALELRRNLLHWEQALSLATTLAPDEVTVIAREYAQQLEFDEKYSDALTLYEKALSTSSSTSHLPAALLEEHQIACSAGLTRMTLRLGDISRGMKMLAHTADRQLLSDCGAILDSLKQWSESATCHERTGMWERAAEGWIKAKNWAKVGALLDKTTSPKVFGQYAIAKEAEGHYTEAASAYEKARDYDALVRLMVDHLHNVEGAVALVRKTRSRESAKMVARYFMAQKDYRSVVEFYLMAGMSSEAFELAQQQGVMEYYADLVKDEADQATLHNIATYFETHNQLLMAGQYHLLAEDYPRALKMFLRAPVTPDGKSIEMAIETVGVAQDDRLTHVLIDFLMGEGDGVPKDAKYIFKLYMSLRQYKEAARTAIIIAREEQTLGNYRAAHDLLLDNYRQLRATKEKIPAEIERMLMLLHSYILVKILVRANDHPKSAKLLIRVASNISKVPAHTVPILTSTVIECHRSGLKNHAFEFAAVLMRPEYRNKLDAKYRKKVEGIVRRPDRDEEEEPTSPCPFCANFVPEMTLDCPECKNHLPYCIATGRHMTLTDWSICPHCHFPALKTHLQALVQSHPYCPMCSEALTEGDVRLVKDPKAYLKGLEEVEEVEGVGAEKVVKESVQEECVVPAAGALRKREREGGSAGGGVGGEGRMGGMVV